MAPRIARLIPHPGVRIVATIAASYILPYIVEQLVARSASAVMRRKALAATPRAA